MRIASIKDLPLREGKRVLLRVDLNVPLDALGRISDDTRIRATIPTIQALLRKKAIVLVLSHLGRPMGVDERLRMDPVAERLGELLGQHVLKLDDCVGSEVEDEVNEAHSGDVVVLENVRFHPEEEANDDAFARGMAELADFYVNDAFGAAHREHASIVGIPLHIPGVAGLLMEREIEMLGRVIQPKKPFVLVVGGAKAKDKIGLVENLARKADRVLLAGAIAFTFLKALGKKVGASQFERDKLALARKVVRKYGHKLVFPTDWVIARAATANALRKTVAADAIPAGWRALDIGPETIRNFCAELRRARTIVWNGTLGVAELAPFAKGTQAIARAIARTRATTVVGGGSVAGIVQQLRLSGKFTHFSTGGGATLEFLEGRTLPGIAALEKSARKFFRK